MRPSLKKTLRKARRSKAYRDEAATLDAEIKADRRVITKKVRRIVCAAMVDHAGNIICSPRHWDAIAREAVRRLGGDWKEAEQGFVDQVGEFLSREDAWKIAEAAGQIIRRVGGDETNGGRLYSENLY